MEKVKFHGDSEYSDVKFYIKNSSRYNQFQLGAKATKTDGRIDSCSKVLLQGVNISKNPISREIFAYVIRNLKRKFDVTITKINNELVVGIYKKS